MSKQFKGLDGVYSEFYATHLAGGVQPRYRESPYKTKKTGLASMYWRVLTELSLNRFKWDNLPDTVDERFLELSIMRHGGVLFFRYAHRDYGEKYLVQQFTGVGRPNHYDNPTQFRIVSGGGISGVFSPSDAVPIWGNYLRQPDHDIVQVFTDRLTEIDTTIDVNIANMRYPRILVYPEEARLTMENISRQLHEGYPTIKLNAANRDLNDPNTFGSLDTGSHHETVPGLLAAKGKLWNDALMMLGVPTINQDKKERMITGEVESGQDQSKVIRQIALNSRQQAVEQINELFNLNISVSWRADEDLTSMANSMGNMLGVGSGNHENHDRPTSIQE